MFRLTANGCTGIGRVSLQTGREAGGFTVQRVLMFAVLAGWPLALTGCTNTWETLSSRKWRKDPWNTTVHMIKPEDPLVVLRADPPRDGDERAAAMRRLKEPLAIGLSQQDQDQIIDLLGRTATTDTSPVLRIAAIEALGRFEDNRAAGILAIAYQKAHGRADGVPDPVAPENDIQLAGVGNPRGPNKLASLVPLTGPVGFSPETVDAVRCRALESMGHSSKTEVAQFLGNVATNNKEERDVRLAAVRGLAKCRQPESVAALAKVLAEERGKDTALAGRAHEGLVHLTGQKLPPDPKQWDALVKNGATIAPEPTWIQATIDRLMP